MKHTKCYVCGREVLLFKAPGKPLKVKRCCHQSCFEIAWISERNRWVEVKLL